MAHQDSTVFPNLLILVMFCGGRGIATEYPGGLRLPEKYYIFPRNDWQKHVMTHQGLASASSELVTNIQLNVQNYFDQWLEVKQTKKLSSGKTREPIHYYQSLFFNF